MKALGRVLLVIALALAGAIAVSTLVRGGVETDLFAMVGGGSDSADAALLAELNAISADSVRVLCADLACAESIRARYPFDPPMDPAAFLATVRDHGRGLLTPKSREQLERGELDRIRRSVRRRDYTGVGLFPKADDPYYFLNDFAVAFKALQPEGLPDGAVILTGRGSAIEAAVPGGLLALVREAEETEGLWLSGSPFHAALAQRSTVREINVLGAVSLLAVLLFGWMLFRSFRFVLPMTGAIACGFLAATGAVCLLPGRPHALTFLFGTTLIGLGVDYCYHALSPERAATDFVRKLTGALLTTSFAFVPLLFSSVSVLRQMSVFSISGLVTIYAFVLLFRNEELRMGNERLRLCTGPWGRLVGWAGWILAAGVLMFFILHSPSSNLHFSSDPALFHKPAPVMARGEAKFASLSGESTGLRLVNLTRWQEENAALKARLGEEPSGSFLTASDLPAGMAFTRGGDDFLVLPESAAEAIVGRSGTSVDLRKTLQDIFARFMGESRREAAYALVLLFVGALAVFGRRVLSIFFPPTAAVVLTLLTLGVLREPITFFHILCFFIIIGLGIDYAIFHQGGDRPRAEGEKVGESFGPSIVFFSFLTSLVGFGLLAFTSFPVTRGMGLTLAIGLFWAYFLSLARGDRPHNPGDRPQAAGAWHEQKEQSAGRFRILLMWYFYRFLGKNAAKILFLPGYLFIYPFCKPARAALRQYYGVLGVKDRSFRHILEFAWSMLDKTDACTLCKNPPSFTLAGDTDWMKGGCFLLSTHLGCIEVMPALRKSRGQTPRVHAFQQMGHDAVFTQVFAEHMDANQLTLHAVEDIGVETAVEMKSAIEAGDIVLMAADRPSAGSKAVLRQRFLGRDCVWPKGVFRFARMMESPIYAIICVKTGWNSYEIVAKRMGTDPLADYVAFLEENVRRYPYQWYQFYKFFG